MSLLLGGSSVRAETPRPAEFPFEIREGLLWVKVTAPKSKTPLNFLVDTGASSSVVNLATVDSLRLKRGGPINVRGVDSTVSGYWPTRFTGSIEGISMPRDFLALDLTPLSQSCQRPVDGLLGLDFFREHIVQIDYAASIIRVLKSQKEPRLGETIPLKLELYGMRVPISVDDGEVRWVRLDTGCSSSLQWVAPEMEPKDAVLGTAVGLTKLSYSITQTSVRIGKSEFHAVPTGLHKKEIFAGEAGLLGNGLLSKFSQVTLDARAGRLTLK